LLITHVLIGEGILLLGPTIMVVTENIQQIQLYTVFFCIKCSRWNTQI